jgi:peptidoglycan/LPS O-acetylase OafA/YrhL
LREGRTLAFPLPTIVSAVIVAVIYVVTAFDPVRWVRVGQQQLINGVDQIAPTESIIILPLLVVLIASLAISRRDPLVWLLSTRPFVLGGKVSFALYLSHPLVIGAAVAVLAHFAPTSLPGRAVTVLAVAAAWVFAWVLWRLIEEPSRKIARRMLPASINV